MAHHSMLRIFNAIFNVWVITLHSRLGKKIIILIYVKYIIFKCEWVVFSSRCSNFAKHVVQHPRVYITF